MHHKASPPTLSSAVKSYVAGFVLLSLVATVLLTVAYQLPAPLTLLFCSLIFLVGELISFDTPTGRGNVSMAAMMHLAMVPIFPVSTLAIAVWCSRFPGELIIHKKPWYRAAFNSAQISLALIAASLVFRSVVPNADLLNSSSITSYLPGLMCATAFYYVINHAAVVGVITLFTNGSFWVVARENYGSRVQLVNSLAVFLIAPIATIVYQSLGFLGVGVLTLPTLLLRDACRRFFALERAQQALISSERLAAKGEMAASVAHELNNYLAVLSGNLQIIQMRGTDLEPEALTSKLDKGIEQVNNMASLAKGLMDFSSIDSKPQPTRLSQLIEETVEFLRPQNRFDPVSISLDCDPRVGTVVLDPGQMQQVLMNLLNNAADAMRDDETTDRRIWITTGLCSSESTVEITVTDSGPGIPQELMARILDPGFTTKHDGHGFGLSTVFKIVQNHHGTMVTETSAIGGALFRIRLPLEGERTERRAA